MIVQHNIMAINSHRQLGINNTNLSKNLEKLSSGYRINKAADDAAGLAISEKMRAQITALDRAVLNAQDGASLIQTAEGALQEVHGMLNRMVELATQSANGTIQADDRQKIESELTALKDEIDRISQATNFNGIKLLDGSLAGSGATSGGTAPAVKLAGLEGKTGYVAATNATATAAVTQDGTGVAANGEKIKYGVVLDDGTAVEVEFTYAQKTDAADTLVAADGTEYAVTTTKPTTAQLNAAIKAELLKNDTISSQFEVSDALAFTSKDAGANAPSISNIYLVTSGSTNKPTIAATAATKGADAYETIGLSSMTELINDKTVFEVNGKKFQILLESDTEGIAAAAKEGINVLTTVDNTPDQAAINSIAAQLNAVTGLGTAYDGAVDDLGGNTEIGLTFKPAAVAAGTSGIGGLTMQVGESDEDYQKITVSVDDMSSSGLGIKNISMATQEASSAALKKINAAIEKVSVNRGNLGALQNRLEHTINNLNVTSENMTAAESRIRDVDMAKEMMQFTKNNVLSQAAQAMLAQSNMQPQNVLQLLR